MECVGWKLIRYDQIKSLPPKLLPKESHRRKLLSRFGLPYGFRQDQLDRQFIATISVVGYESRHVIESILARLKTKSSSGRLYEVVFYVRTFIWRKSHRKSHCVWLRRLPDHEASFLFALQKMEGTCPLDSRQEPDWMGTNQAFNKTYVACCPIPCNTYRTFGNSKYFSSQMRPFGWPLCRSLLQSFDMRQLVGKRKG